ncbi:MAG: uroporphyrinogen decarboxylase family protein [Verrucomicrobia bacterium]|nr:uroporphyrinogen decarboxylase family protein [Verrucomicrobiota bacterium]
MTSRERILAHLAGQPVDHLPLMPITMMFACGQIGATYRDYCTDYRVLVEGQIRTAEKYGFDYVNTMSDPAREAADCGAKVEYFDHQPVAIVEDEALLADKSTLATLKIPDPLGGGRMTNGIKALTLFKEKLGQEKIIEGWVEGPIAEAADLRGINTVMTDFFDDPAFVRDLFEFVVELELRFAREQVKAGADLIGIGDAAASLVGPQIYEEFVLPYEKKLVEGIHACGGRTRLHICGNTRRLLGGMGRLGCHIVDLDSLSPLADARRAMGANQVLLGNVNPVTVLRNGNPDIVTNAIAECHRQAGARYIVGAGCEVPRDTPPENLRALCEYAKSHKPDSGPV